MKILVLTHEYPPFGGGGGVFAQDLTEEWAKAGHLVAVVTAGDQKKALPRNTRGVTVHQVYCGSRPDLAKASIRNLFWFLIKGFNRARKLSRKEDYDYLVTHFALPAGPIGFLLQLFYRKKNILVMHGADIYDPTRRMSGHQFWLTRKVIELVVNRADWVVASTPEISSRLKEFYQTPKEVRIIPLGFKPPLEFKAESVDRSNSSLASPKRTTTSADSTKSAKAPLRLITVGRLVKRKNVEFLIKALAKRKDQAELIVVGNGPERSVLESLAQKLGLPVNFLGRLSEKEKYQALAKADLFTMASWHEGFGLVFLEAMSVGLPILTSDRGGQVHFLKDQENALFFSPAKIDSFLLAFDFFYQNREKLREFGGNNQQAVRQFHIHRIANRYLELMR